MTLMTLRWQDDELKIIRELARKKDMNLSSFIRTATREKLERDFGISLEEEINKGK